MTTLELTQRLKAIMHPVDVTPEMAERILAEVRSWQGRQARNVKSKKQSEQSRINGRKHKGKVKNDYSL